MHRINGNSQPELAVLVSESGRDQPDHLNCNLTKRIQAGTVWPAAAARKFKLIRCGHNDFTITIAKSGHPDSTERSGRTYGSCAFGSQAFPGQKQFRRHRRTNRYQSCNGCRLSLLEGTTACHGVKPKHRTFPLFTSRRVPIDAVPV